MKLRFGVKLGKDILEKTTNKVYAQKKKVTTLFDESKKAVTSEVYTQKKRFTAKLDDSIKVATNEVCAQKDKITNRIGDSINTAIDEKQKITDNIIIPFTDSFKSKTTELIMLANIQKVKLIGIATAIILEKVKRIFLGRSEVKEVLQQKKIAGEFGSHIKNQFELGNYTSCDIGLTDFAVIDGDKVYAGILEQDNCVVGVLGIDYEVIDPNFQKELIQNELLILE